MISRLGRDYRQHFYGPHCRISRYPSTGACNAMSQQEEAASIASKLEGVHFIRLLWCNGAGLRSCRVLPLSKDSKVREDQLQGLAEQAGPALTCAAMCLPVWGDVPAPDSGFGPIGSVRMQLDMSTIRIIPWHFSHAFAHVNMYDPTVKGTWSVCPRGMLRRILSQADEMGYSLRVGFELEFALIKPDGTPVDNRTYCSASAFDAMAELLDDVSNALDALGCTVEQLHAEAGPGQFEVVLTHDEPMAAADSLLFAKEAIIAVARKHGLRAVFLPKYRAEQAGNGLHCHVSLWHGGRNLLPLPLDHVTTDLPLDSAAAGIDPRMTHFLAGVLQHLPGMMCFTTPTPNSFRRLQPGCWAGAYHAWGLDNKEAPLRLPLQPWSSGLFTNVEFKMMDHTANPHVALAAIVASGLIGLRHEWRLPRAVQVDPAILSSQELERMGVKPLPRSFQAAADCLLSDEYAELRGALGKEAVQCLLAVRRSEWVKLSGVDLEAEVELLADRY